MENFLAAAGRFKGGTHFAEWLLRHGVTSSAVLSSYHQKNMGYGLAMSRQVAKGEEVLRIPSAIWRPFSAETAIEQAPVALVQRVDDVVGALAEHSGGASQPEHLKGSMLLALHLLVEMGRSEPHPYLDFMPREVGTPLFWEPNELEEIKGTSAMGAVMKRAEFIRVFHEALFPAGTGIPRVQLAWALALLLSRAHSGKGQPLSMVPFLCCANHAVNPGCSHGYDEETDSYYIVAERDHDVGEQVLISYGAHDNARLLWQYGFALPDNPLTATTVSWSQETDASDPLYSLKQDLLERYGLAGVNEFQVLPHPRGEPPPALMAKCRILSLCGDDVTGGGASSDGPPDVTQVVNERNEAEARQGVADVAAMALKGYPTTLEQDEALQGSAAEDHGPRWMYSLLLRVDEKLLLERMRAWGKGA